MTKKRGHGKEKSGRKGVRQQLSFTSACGKEGNEMSGQITKRSPRGLFSPLAHGLREEMEELTSRFWGTEGDGWPVGRLTPSVDIVESEGALEARVDLPGVKPEEIDIQLAGNLLTISGERKEEEEEKGKTFHRIERRTGSFSRCVSLPCTVEEDEVAAEYHDGVLVITLPKTDEAKSRKIKVKS